MSDTKQQLLNIWTTECPPFSCLLIKRDPKLNKQYPKLSYKPKVRNMVKQDSKSEFLLPNILARLLSYNSLPKWSQIRVSSHYLLKLLERKNIPTLWKLLENLVLYFNPPPSIRFYMSPLSLLYITYTCLSRLVSMKAKLGYILCFFSVWCSTMTPYSCERLLHSFSSLKFMLFALLDTHHIFYSWCKCLQRLPFYTTCSPTLNVS